MSLTIQSRVYDFALKCSKTYRAGKFERVGSEFKQGVETDIDNIIRKVQSLVGETLHPQLQPDAAEDGTPGEDVRLIGPEAIEKLRQAAEIAVRRLIQNRVQRTPSCGKTL